MSLRAVDSQRSFYRTDYLAGNLFGPANRYRLFREKIWPKLLELAPKLEARFKEVAAKKKFKKDDVVAGREYVKSYVEFIHYVERLYEAAKNSAEGHFREAEEAGAAKKPAR